MPNGDLILNNLVRVEQEHIDSGERDCCFKCPIAKAISEKVDCQVAVGSDIVLLYKNEQNHCYLDLPSEVYRKQALWDLGESMIPFEFSLAIPKEYLRP